MGAVLEILKLNLGDQKYLIEYEGVPEILELAKASDDRIEDDMGKSQVVKDYITTSMRTLRAGVSVKIREKIRRKFPALEDLTLLEKLYPATRIKKGSEVKPLSSKQRHELQKQIREVIGNDSLDDNLQYLLKKMPQGSNSERAFQWVVVSLLQC